MTNVHSIHQLENEAIERELILLLAPKRRARLANHAQAKVLLKRINVLNERMEKLKK